MKDWMRHCASELATVVDEESAYLDALIGEAVEMAELDANVLKVELAPRHTRTLLEHAVEESHKALGRHQVMLMVQEPDSPVWFDARLLGRVFRHLIENAALYSPPESRIVLRSRRVEGRLEFEVEDSGPGIDKVDLPHIFEKFYRGKRGAKLGKGTGMGLAIARAIMLAHGGGIAVESNPEHGSTFRFWVPLVEKQAAETVPAVIRPVRRSSRIRCRAASPSFLSPTQAPAPLARLLQA